jgi:hypothetical protein
MSRVEQALAEFPAEAVTNKLLRALYSTVPYSPAFEAWGSVDDAVRALKPGATGADLQRARDIANNADEIGDVLWMGRIMDAGDRGFAVVSGLFTAWKLFQGQGAAALETDPQQRSDAALKALGLAYLVYKAYPGSLAEKARAFRESPTGQALAVYYGAVEVALPFADNAAQMGTDGLTSLLQSQGQAQAARLSELAQGKDLGRASEMLTEVTGQLQRVAGHTAGYVKPVTAAIGPYLPGAMSMADKAAGALASAADVLPIYTLLAARLAAESAARRAVTLPA